MGRAAARGVHITVFLAFRGTFLRQAALKQYCSRVAAPFARLQHRLRPLISPAACIA
jgi:hypothetical protein